jgi:hypothetical protein
MLSLQRSRFQLPRTGLLARNNFLLPRSSGIAAVRIVTHYECQRVGETVGETERKLRLHEKPKFVVRSLTSGFKLTLAAQQGGEGQNTG